MKWNVIKSGDRNSIDWNVLRQSKCEVDPYLIWGNASAFRGFETLPGGKRLQVAVEYREGVDLGCHLRCITKLETGTHLAVGEIEREEFVSLLRQDGVLRFEFGMTVGDAKTGAAAREPAPIGGPVVAVIDFGCAFAHCNFRKLSNNSWQSRIRFLWDQNRSREPNGCWREVCGQGYGRELDHEAIAALLNRHGANGGVVDEDACYAEARYTDVQTDFVHGTHVLDLAAGSHTPGGDPNDPSIIFVQLPTAAVADTSGASMVVHVCDALKYILARVDASSTLVVNLSYGSMAGPHDGSTLLERAMDAIIQKQQRKRSFEIVLPAGNNYESACHAEVTLTKTRKSQSLHWQIMASDATDTFLEVWYDKKWSHKVHLIATPPSGSPQKVGCDEWWLGRHEDGGEPFCAVIHTASPSYGKDMAMVLIAVAPTQPTDSTCGRAPCGVWTVQIIRAADDEDEKLEVFAWIERDDPQLATGLQQIQSCFVSRSLPDTRDNAFNPVKRHSTGNSIANGTSTVVVGSCLRLRQAIAPYSSAGPTRNRNRAPPWPDVVFDSDDDEINPGTVAAGTRSGVQVRMGGTSAAAPQVTRYLMREFAKALPQHQPRQGGGSAPAPAPVSARNILKTAKPLVGVSADRNRGGGGKLPPR